MDRKSKLSSVTEHESKMNLLLAVLAINNSVSVIKSGGHGNTNGIN